MYQVLRYFPLQRGHICTKTLQGPATPQQKVNNREYGAVSADSTYKQDQACTEVQLPECGTGGQGALKTVVSNATLLTAQYWVGATWLRGLVYLIIICEVSNCVAMSASLNCML